jgi:hypothetical protein
MWEQMGLYRRGIARPLRLLALPLALAADGGWLTAEADASPRLFADLAAPRDSAAAVTPANQLGFFVNDIDGSAGRDTPVTVVLPSAEELAGAGTGSFLLVRNIPAGVRLSAGMSSGRLWVVPLNDVAGLKLFAEENAAAGRFALEFNLIGANNKPLAKQTVALNLQRFEIAAGTETAAAIAVGAAGPAEDPILEPPPPIAHRAPPERQPEPGPQLASRTAPAEKPQPAPDALPRGASPGSMASPEEGVLLGRAEELLRQGGMAAARILLEELARKGSAKGALALARSYDPAYTPGSRASALNPSLDKALEWYRRADELGSAEAKERIAELVPRRR